MADKIPLSYRQHGVVLLAMTLALLSTGLIVISHLLLVESARQSELRRSAEALVAARTALIAFAVNYADNYGHNTRGGTGRLPCPAADKFSAPVSSCSNTLTGFLPALWKRNGKLMDIDYLERYLDRDLWYAVSADYRFNPSTNSLNPASDQHLLEVDGIERIVAVIIDPGPPLPHQRGRRPGADVDAYLEAENADGDNIFSTSSGIGNDRLVWITADELLPLMERRVLGQVRDWLVEYHRRNGYYPYASEFGDPEGNCVAGLTQGFLSLSQGACDSMAFGEFRSATVPNDRKLNQTWFARNQWHRFIHYQVAENCVQFDNSCIPEELSLSVNGQTVQVLLASSGRELDGSDSGVSQNRQLAPDSREAYFELESLVEGEDTYQLPPIPRHGNDQWLAVRPVLQ